MNTFLISIDATTTVNGATPPTLEVLVGGVVVSSVTMNAGADTYNLFAEYTGAVPSSVSLRFNAGTGDPADTITFTTVSVNDQPLNIITDLSSSSIGQGSSSTVSAAADVYGHTTPTLGTPTITGTGGNDDSLSGGNAADVIDGLAGNDRIRGKGNDDSINGGNGDDYIFGEDGADTILGGAGNDIIFGNADDDVLYGEGDNDYLIGGAGNDIINGGAGVDGLIGDAGDDVMFGEAGDDWLSGDAGDDVMFGDDGNDFLIGGADNDALSGGDGNDQLFGDSGNDLLNGGDGDDEIFGGTGNDIASAGAGSDHVYGGDGVDELAGGADNDYISGGDGADTLDGDSGADVLNGGDGADTLNGGADADVLHGHGLDADTISSILFANPNVVYSEDSGSFYQFVNANVNFATAEANAAATTLNGLAGHLATITTDAENTFVASILTDNSWHSGTDSVVNTEWVWSAGIEAGAHYSNGGTAANNMYENWDSGQPQNNTEHNALIYTNGTWHDWPDTSTHSYVIEWEGGLFSDDNAVDTLNGGSGNDFLYGYGGNDVLNGDENQDVLFGHDGDDTLDGGSGSDVLYANRGHLYSLSSTTLISEAFGSDTGVFTYSDGGFGGSDPANVSITGTRNTGDGNLANGSLQVYVDGQNNSAFSNGSGSWDTSVTASDNVSNVQISFAYRHVQDRRNDNNEDSQVWFEFDGVTYDGSGGNSFINEHQGAGGGGPDDDTGWVTVTINLPDLTAGNTYNMSVGIIHLGSNRNNEDAYVRIDDVVMTGDVLTLAASDLGSANTLNGGSGADTLYGSSGADFLNGDADADIIYSGSTETLDSTITQILNDNAGVVYSSDTNSFYQYVTTNLSWTNANNAANASTLTGLTGVNGHLVTETSATENAFISNLVGANRVWTGASDATTEGEWFWVVGPENGLQFWTGGAAGTNFNSHYANWTPGDPSNANAAWDYAEHLAAGDWWSNSITATHFYVIEWEGDSLLNSVDKTTIDGGLGADTLYGSQGIDIFDFNNTDAMDTLEGFNAAGRDQIDISDLLTGFNYLTNDITDFVQLTESGGNTTLAVDSNGLAGGSSYTNIVQINDVTGLDLHTLVAGDNLIV